MLRPALLPVLSSVLLHAPNLAQTRSDAGFWPMVLGQGPLGASDSALGSLRWWFDFQLRYAGETDGLDQVIVRPGLGYTVAQDASAWLGYAWIRDELPRGGDSEENRIWQQYLWTKKLGDFTLQSRTRLEQRFLSTGDDVGWRARQFVKSTLPLGDSSPLFLSAFDEVFFDLNETDWGQRTGFTQNRLFLGLGFRLGSGVNTEVGYLNQFVYRDRAEDSVNHILSVNLLLTF